jgi:hypothetical protein
MSTCPHHQLRKDLPPLIPRIAKLPVDERGYPVPFFVSWIKGKPEFRMADSQKLRSCLIAHLCWVCGEKLGKEKTFAIGPMCAVNRVSAEPPSHLECCEWSVRGCPFLAKPQMKRREDELTEANKKNVAGIMIERNPGVTGLWTTKSYTKFSDGMGGQLLRIGDPLYVSWWREGRPATRAEVLESIDTGVPNLEKVCRSDTERDALKESLAKLLSSGLLPVV